LASRQRVERFDESGAGTPDFGKRTKHDNDEEEEEEAEEQEHEPAR